jgi:valyl-tRNA synthetase
MTDYAFGEVTRLLQDAIWNEFCDWGVELAKVRLADETLEPAVREATWWTLVEVLDTYLRLLHPVMPFVTEAMWGAIPHRASDPDLLIVARWPVAGERDLALEASIDELIALITEIRNARASARLPAGDVLETWVYIPGHLAETFEALRPAVARLTRADPLHRVLTPEALHAAAAPTDLVVIVPSGDLEATIRPQAVDARASELEQERLERELADAERFLAAARQRLSDEAFLAKAPAAVVDGARAREAELSDQVERLRDRLGR